MRKIKALMLGLLILVPIFVFIFIYTFGEHHFKVKGYYPETNDKGEVLLNEKGDTLFQTVQDFTLTDQSSNSFSQADLQGKIYVVNFFYTDCPDLCRKMSSQLVRVQDAYQNNPTIALVSITTKPEEDSASVLKGYAAEYSADTTKWHFLTGSKKEIYSLAQNGFKLPLQKTGGPEDFLHSDRFMLVDKENKVRGVYKGTSVTDVDRLILEINVLLDEYSKSK
ncbi:SCO family protein [Pontibacter sp. BT310]|uniref:SCO family protein n=1 Tax=Pontibacter populi TaxID=890055 RepID=A0ABS6X9C0_9BACT|nr:MULTISPECIES: SCO family protein [Pontibacter]MBJ6116917.1 SCO family protein [Pontibacter sp. BT310]MBR0569341.1 SCO family protein [Microvirga sp. STS03]MBW3363770.1 SCO family protein [Pontibacter populi]